MKPGINYIGIGCGALIINDRDETLLVKRGPNSKNEVGVWSKPGGAVEFGEKVEDAVKREIKEELDIDIELIRFLGFTNHIIKTESQHWISFNYLARIIGREPEILEPGKIEEIRWFSLNKLPQDITQNTIESVKGYLEKYESHL